MSVSCPVSDRIMALPSTPPHPLRVTPTLKLAVWSESPIVPDLTYLDQVMGRSGDVPDRSWESGE